MQVYYITLWEIKSINWYITCLFDQEDLWFEVQLIHLKLCNTHLYMLMLLASYNLLLTFDIKLKLIKPVHFQNEVWL